MSTKVLTSVDDGQAEFAEGGGLPSQWTDGGNGDVTATADTDHTPFTIAPSDEAPYALFIQLPANFFDNANAIFRILDADGNHLFNLDDGGLDLKAIGGEDDYGSYIRLNETDTVANVWMTSRRVELNDGSTSPITKLSLSLDQGFILSGSIPATAPDNQQLNLYFDSTPGSASLKIRAKDDNGTVVTATVPLT